MCVFVLQESKRHLSGLSALGIGSMVKEITGDVEECEREGDEDGDGHSDDGNANSDLSRNFLTDSVNNNNKHYLSTITLENVHVIPQGS